MPRHRSNWRTRRLPKNGASKTGRQHFGPHERGDAGQRLGGWSQAASGRVLGLVRDTASWCTAGYSTRPVVCNPRVDAKTDKRYAIWQPKARYAGAGQRCPSDAYRYSSGSCSRKAQKNTSTRATAGERQVHGTEKANTIQRAIRGLTKTHRSKPLEPPGTVTGSSKLANVSCHQQPRTTARAGHKPEAVTAPATTCFRTLHKPWAMVYWCALLLSCLTTVDATVQTTQTWSQQEATCNRHCEHGIHDGSDDTCSVCSNCLELGHGSAECHARDLADQKKVPTASGQTPALHMSCEDETSGFP